MAAAFFNIAYAADTEVLQRTLGLGAPQLIARDLDLAKAVGF
jgi:hypothetical protein